MVSEAEKNEDILDEEELKETETPETGDDGTADPEENAENAEDTAEETGDDDIADGEILGTVEDDREKKTFFKKKDKKDEKDAKIDELTDQLKRLMAEFDNYRKRTDKEKAAQYDMGIMKAVDKLLPVIDNFERGLTAVPEEEREGAAYKGMDLIYKQLIKMLTDMGVEPIEATGKEFDPNLHNAVMQAEASDEFPENTVVMELQKGYTYKGSVVRYSAVSVAQ